MASPGLLRWTGGALASAGVLTLLINAGLTPLLEQEAPWAESAASSVFLWRQSLSALAAALLLFGAIGLHLRQAERSGRFGAVAFVLALVGSALLLAAEWGEVFLVRALALAAPDALAALEAGDGPSLYDLGAMISFVVFTLGWIALAISMLRTGVFSRRGPALVIAGFFAIPLLGGPLGTGGLIAGNAVLALGWFWLGRELGV